MTINKPDGIHKIVITKIDETTSYVTFYELMGNRWVMLGHAEVWDTQLAIESYRNY